MSLSIQLLRHTRTYISPLLLDQVITKSHQIDNFCQKTPNHLNILAFFVPVCDFPLKATSARRWRLLYRNYLVNAPVLTPCGFLPSSVLALPTNTWTRISNPARNQGRNPRQHRGFANVRLLPSRPIRRLAPLRAGPLSGGAISRAARLSCYPPGQVRTGFPIHTTIFEDCHWLFCRQKRGCSGFDSLDRMNGAWNLGE